MNTGASCQLLHHTQNFGADVSYIAILLDQGASPNFQRPMDQHTSPFMMLARTANIDGLRCVFSKCTDVLKSEYRVLDSQGEGGGGFDAVYYAMIGPKHPHPGMPVKNCQQRYVDALRVMKEVGGINVEYLFRNGSRTPSIVFAAQNGRKGSKIVKYLLEIGADPNARSTRFGGQTALHAAVEQGSLTTVNLLLNAGCNTMMVLHNEKSSLAVEGAIESMDMRSADAIFRWEEEHGIKHYDESGNCNHGGGTSSATNVLLVRRYVDVYRQTGDATGGLGNLPASCIPVGIIEKEATVMLTEEEQAAMMKMINESTGGECDGSMLPASFTAKFQEVASSFTASLKTEDKSEAIQAKQKAMRERKLRRIKQGKMCAMCGKPGIGSELKQCPCETQVFYCNSACQKQHWTVHKSSCPKRKKKKKKKKKKNGGGDA